MTFAPDEIDWDDEVRVALEERASLSPDALTGMEANLRFAGPETMETKIFGRLIGLAELDLPAPQRGRREGRAHPLRPGRRAADLRHAANLMSDRLEGSCSCALVRYRLNARPMFVHCCHCTLCQKQTGSAFVLNALIETSNVELLEGAPVAVPVPTESGRAHDIYRCPRCQVALWSDYGRRGVMRFVRVSTLDRPHELAPDVHIYTRSKVPWLRLPDGVRAFAEYYDTQQEWPKESLKRRAAILGPNK